MAFVYIHSQWINEIHKEFFPLILPSLSSTWYQSLGPEFEQIQERKRGLWGYSFETPIYRESGVTPPTQEGLPTINEQGHQVQWSNSECLRLMHRSQLFGRHVGPPTTTHILHQGRRSPTSLLRHMPSLSNHQKRVFQRFLDLAAASIEVSSCI